MENVKAKRQFRIILVACILGGLLAMAFGASAVSNVQEFNKYLFAIPVAAETDGAQQGSVSFAARMPSAPDLPSITFTLAADGIVKTTSGTAVAAYIAQSDYSDATINAWDMETLEEYDVTLIHPGTARYNCHSYAWHQASDSNIYYVGDISAYLNDPHCTEISNAVVGAIVVYYDSEGNPLHSAIVKTVTNGTVTCRSKWGVCGVFEHELNEVPSDYMANGVVNEKYYVYERSHTYSDELEYTSTHHMQVCTVCDYETAIVQHSYVITYTAQNHTTSCADCNYRSTMNHSYTVTHSTKPYKILPIL